MRKNLTPAALRKSIFAVGVLILLVTPVSLQAQIDTGSILGTVKDVSGAAIPGAKVTLTNINTSFSLVGRTNARGEYVFTPLHVGTYRVQAEFRGFQTEIRQPITVNIQRQSVVDFTLSPGRVTQEVQVTGAAPLLQTQSSSRGQVIGAKQINDLPLNGRNFTLLAQLAPGTTTVAQESRGLIQSGSFIANGVDTLFNNYILDGLDNNNNTVDFLNGAAFAVLPPPDAIQEFNIQTSNFSAELGRAGGAVLNASVKSGTNQLHGDAWEFLRNDQFDSTDYFLNAAGKPKGEYRRNQFGGTLGGPVVIPHIYNGRNKTFFFGDYSGTRIRQGIPFTSSVPTAEEQASGFTDLSEQITGQSGNVPSDILGRTIPNGTVFDPATTRAVTANVVDPVTGLVATRNGFVSDPFYLASCGSLVGMKNFTTKTACLNQIPANRISQQAVKLLNLFPLPNGPGIVNNYVSNPVKTDDTNAFDVRVDQNFSAKDQLFVRGSYASEPLVLPTPLPGLAAGGQSFAEGTQTNSNISTVLGETHIFSPTTINEFRLGYHRIHTVRLQPFATTGGINQQYGIPGVPDQPPNGGLTQIKISGLSEMGGHNNLPLDEISDDYQLEENITKIHGSHTFKAGFEYQRMRVGVYSAAYPHGIFNFGGGISSFLLTPIATTIPNGIDNVGGATNVQISPLGQEDYRRPYYAGYFQDDWKATRRLTLNLGLRYEYYELPHDKHDRLANFVPGAPGNGAEFQIQAGSQSVGLSQNFLNALKTNGIQLVYSNNPALGTAQKTDFAPRVGFAFQPANKWVIRAAFGIYYAGIFNQGDGGNLGNNYPFNFTLNFNPPDGGHPITPNNSIGILPNGFLNVPISPSLAGGTGLNLQGQQLYPPTPYTQEANLTVQYEISPNQSLSLAYVGSFGRHLMATPGLNLPTEILPPNLNPQNYVPFPGFARNSFGYMTMQGSSYYHSMQAKFERRFSHGLNVLAAYTWSQARSDVYDQLIGGHTWRAPYLPGFGIQGDYGLANYDVGNAVHFSGGYELPFGKGREHAISNGALNAVLGGWSANWILTLQSGPPFTVGCTVGTVAGMGCVALLSGQGLYAGGHTVAHWLNAAAFANPPFATTVGQTDYAPLGGEVTQAFGPGFHRFDLGLMKQFHITESKYFELRGSFFNLTNTPNFALPGSLTFTNPKNFSQITATRDSPDDPREIQLGLKFYF